MSTKRNFQNSVTIQGYIGKTFLNEFSEELTVTKTSLIIPRTDKDDQPKDPIRITLTAFNGVGKALHKSNAGDHIIIFGSLNSSYFTPEGQEKEVSKMEVIVSKFETIETYESRQKRKTD